MESKTKVKYQYGVEYDLYMGSKIDTMLKGGSIKNGLADIKFEQLMAGKIIMNPLSAVGVPFPTFLSGIDFKYIGKAYEYQVQKIELYKEGSNFRESAKEEKNGALYESYTALGINLLGEVEIAAKATEYKLSQASVSAMTKALAVALSLYDVATIVAESCGNTTIENYLGWGTLGAGAIGGAAYAGYTALKAGSGSSSVEIAAGALDNPGGYSVSAPKVNYSYDTTYNLAAITIEEEAELLWEASVAPSSVSVTPEGVELNQDSSLTVEGGESILEMTDAEASLTCTSLSINGELVQFD